MAEFELVRITLAELRAQGAGFDEAWAAALAALRPVEAGPVRGGGWRRAPRPAVGAELASTLEALAATKAEWESGYTRGPSTLRRPRAAMALDRELAA